MKERLSTNTETISNIPSSTCLYSTQCNDDNSRVIYGIVKEGNVLFNDALNTFYLRDERERNVLFNDALNTFYLRLYGVRQMVKDHSDSEKGNPLPSHRLLLSINSKGSFICTIPQTG